MASMHALEKHQITPRVIKAIYNKFINSHSYAFPMPPFMTTCRLPRQVAQEHYQLLLAESTQPIYFDPEIDFLYCTSLRVPYVKNYREIEPVLSFLKPSSLGANTRFLVLDILFWREHLELMNQVSDFAAMPELHLLRNSIKDLFLVMPSLEEELADKKLVYGRYVLQPTLEEAESRRQKLESVLAALVKHDEEAIESVVPGFQVYSDVVESMDKEWVLERAFGFVNVPFWGAGWSNSSARFQDRVLEVHMIRSRLR